MGGREERSIKAAEVWQKAIHNIAHETVQVNFTISFIFTIFNCIIVRSSLVLLALVGASYAAPSKVEKPSRNIEVC